MKLIVFVGEWRIAITYSGEHINGSPFPCLVYDSNQVFVHYDEHTFVKKETTISIDTQKAGWGELNIKVDLVNTNKTIPIKIDERGNGIYNISFVPEVVGKYSVFVTFNQQTIKDAPFFIFADANLENKENWPNSMGNVKGQLECENKLVSNGQVISLLLI